MKAFVAERLIDGTGNPPLENAVLLEENGVIVGVSRVADGIPENATQIHYVGSLETGKIADLVLVDGNPLEDIRVLQNRNNLRVFKDGLEVSRANGGLL
jgi:hypothetical protein